MAADLAAEVARKEDLIQKWIVGYERLRSKHRNLVAVCKAQLSEINALRADLKVAKARGRAAAHRGGDEVLLAEIGGLEAALRYYANPKNYEYLEEARGVPILLDHGSTATSALEKSKPIDRAANIHGLEERVRNQKVEIGHLQQRIAELENATLTPEPDER